MKILVAVKQVVDHNIRVKVRGDRSGVETANLRMSMNPFCRHAVEAAIKLMERGWADEVVAVTAGPQRAREVLVTALAMGATRGIHLVADQKLEPLAVAKLLAAVAGEERPDLVILGKQAVDDDAAQTGQMLAGLLDWPQASFASAIAVDDNGLKVTRETEHGRAVFALPTPGIVTADIGLNTPRHVALPMVAAAKNKPIDTRRAETLGVDIAPRLTVELVSPPPARAPGRTTRSVSDVADFITDIIGRIEVR